MTSSLCEIEKLVELFSLSKDDGEQLEDDPANENSQDNLQCSSDQNKTNKEDVVKKKQSPYAKVEQSPSKEVLDCNAVEDELYFEETSSDVGQKGWKKTPKWDISYRQRVTASDVFLGMGFKTASTSSCENMIVTIDLPGENRQNIDLKIEKRSFTLTSPKFLLELNLPHPVDPKRGDAQFDKEGEQLIVTLIMDRELDILNF